MAALKCVNIRGQGCKACKKIAYVETSGERVGKVNASGLSAFAVDIRRCGTTRDFADLVNFGVPVLRLQI